MAEAQEIRPIPRNREAEQVVLGAAMLEPERVIPVLTERLRPEQFYWRAHQTVFRAVLDLFEAGRPADLITIGNRLEEMGKLDEVGGRAYLSELLSKVTTTASIEHYCDILKKKAMLRELIEVGRQIAELGYQEEEEPTQLLDRAEEQIFSISRMELKQSYHELKDFLHEHIGNLEKLQQDPQRRTVKGVPSGYRHLDEMTTGFQLSDLIIIAGRPGSGKSALAISIARHVALRFDKCVGIFSLEMTKEQVLERMLCGEAQINMHRLRGGFLDTDSDAWRRIISAAGKLQNSKILLDDTPAISIIELRAKARRMKSEHDLNLLIVDYLQLVEAHGHSDVREQEVAYITRSLKSLSRELEIPVIALSQLSRAPERPPRRPRLSDLRECLTGDTVIYNAITGCPHTIQELYETHQLIPVHTVTADFRLQVTHPAQVIQSGVKKVFKLRTRTGRELRASANHPFLTIEGWKALKQLRPGERIAAVRRNMTEYPELDTSARSIGIPAIGCRMPTPNSQGEHAGSPLLFLVEAPCHSEPKRSAGEESRFVRWGPDSSACGLRMTRHHHRGQTLAAGSIVSSPVQQIYSRHSSSIDLMWDSIDSIEPCGKELTYDLVVPGTHNFVANDLVVHNSGELEQTADVVLFVYREDYYSDEGAEASAAGERQEPSISETELIIGKQRNGPLGVIKLAFHKSYASFYEPFSQAAPF